MSDMGQYPSGMNWVRYDLTIGGSERVITLADAEDAKALRELVDYLRTVRTTLRGLPQLNTQRTDIHTAGDVDGALEDQIGLLQSAITMLESGDE